MQQTHTHKAMTRRIEAKKSLSRRRQSNYKLNIFDSDIVMSMFMFLYDFCQF